MSDSKRVQSVLFSMFFMLVVIGVLPQVVFGASGEFDKQLDSYVIVVSEDTFAKDEWKEVVETLGKKYDASVIIYRNSVTDVVERLADYMPRYTCFVEPGDTAGREFVVDVQRMTRKLDSDPYTDTQWAILTGYTSGDALRIVKCSEPLVVDKIFSGTVSVGLDNFDEGYQFSEAGPGICKRKLADGSVIDHPCPADSTKAIVEALQDDVDAIYTSGHGMTTGWQIGYNYVDGFIRGDNGQVYGYDSKGKVLNFSTDNTKVYLPVGNCLVGLLPKRDCYATAMMHSAGVNQMFGYTVVTFYGYMGWGINTYFSDMRGEYSLSESFYANQQSLLYEIGVRFPDLLNMEFDGYDYEKLYGEVVKLYPNDMKDAFGMLWDRDAIGFYGDPAWRATVVNRSLPWADSFEKKADGSWQLKITASEDGSWPGRPLVYFLPERLNNIEVISGQEYKAEVTDNFILIPLSGKFEKGESIIISFKGDVASSKLASFDSSPVYVGVFNAIRFEKIIDMMSEEYQTELKLAFNQAGENCDEIASFLEKVKPEHRDAASFLIVNMPKSDLRNLKSDMLVNNVELAFKAGTIKKWDGISQEVFLNDVLPYASLDEVRVDWREELMELSMPIVVDCDSIGQAAEKLNKELWSVVNVKYSTKRRKANQNPIESMESGIASCSGLSILLVDACRSVGIPARIAGIAKWPHKAGNHSWVEIWDGRWYTMGAWDGEGLDKIWFSSDVAKAQKSSRYHGVFATSYKKTGIPFLCVWAPENEEISAVEVTDRYLDTWQTDEDDFVTAFRIFDSADNRVSAEIKIVHGDKILHCDVSRNELNDLNDATAFELVPGEEYVVEVSYQGQKKRVVYTPEEKLFQVVDLKL